MKAGARSGSSIGALVFGLIIGCQASVNTKGNVSGRGARADADAELSGSASGEIGGKGEMSRAGETAQPNGVVNGAFASPAGSPRVLLGARHDLKLRAGTGTASCECLSVALGASRGEAMAWSGPQPDIDEGTQLSLALSSEGQACNDEPKKSLGASYWGYRISGDDVIVLVEAARGGRPLTNGAIIPKPVGTGQVYLAPASKKLAYGRPLSGKGRCKIGNPGKARSTPFTELEVGSDAPTAARRAVTRDKGDPAESRDMPATIELPDN